MARRAKKAQEIASHPFVRRMIEDPEFRNALNEAVGSAKVILGKVHTTKGGAKALVDDRKVQRELAETLEKLHEATQSLARETAAVVEKKRKHRARRVIVLFTAGTAVSFAACPWLRNKALDRLFGAEEEFQYSPPPASPAPSTDAPAPAESSESPVNAV